MKKDKMRGLRFRANSSDKECKYALWVTPELSFTHTECPDKEIREFQEKMLGWKWTILGK